MPDSNVQPPETTDADTSLADALSADRDGPSGPPHACLIAGQAWLRITGADAAGFLQDQLTADLSDWSDENWRLAAICSPKGRVLAIIHLQRDGGVIHARVSADLAETIRARLSMFVLRADVKIDHDPDRRSLALLGDGARRDLSATGLTVPDTAFQAGRHGGLIVARLPGSTVEVSGTTRDLIAFWRETGDRFAPGPESLWHAMLVQQGLPLITAATSDRFLPQSLNLESWRGLSFRKGCFPGQEVVARTRYLGRLKQQLFRGEVTDHEPAAGDELRDGNDARAGTVLVAGGPWNSALTPFLAVMRDDRLIGCHFAERPTAKVGNLSRVKDLQN